MIVHHRNVLGSPKLIEPGVVVRMPSLRVSGKPGRFPQYDLDVRLLGHRHHGGDVLLPLLLEHHGERRRILNFSKVAEPGHDVDKRWMLVDDTGLELLKHDRAVVVQERCRLTQHQSSSCWQ